MIERRQYGRFSHPFPVRIETMTKNGKEVLNLVTKDISACGIFIPTLTSFPVGTRLILDLTFPSNNQPFQDVKSLKGYIGSLVRSTSHGIAIQFDREYQMENFKVL
jgi:hypothetical protein